MSTPQGDPPPLAVGRAVPLVGLDTIRRTLLARADLFEDPRAYEAGVEDALDAVVRALGDVRTRSDAPPPRWVAHAGDRPVVGASAGRVPGG